MNGEDSYPGCIGFHGRPLPPNGPCDKCPCESLCRKVVAKARLKVVLDRLLDVEKTLHGGDPLER